MSLDITVDDVKSVAPNTGATDVAIQMQIDIATEKLDECLTANYSDTIGRAIKIYAVAHFSYKTANASGKLKSRKWADGDSESYQDSTDGDYSEFWDNALSLDSAGCVEAAYKSRKVFVVTGSSSKNYGYPV
jgi:hypothetical protein